MQWGDVYLFWVHFCATLLYLSWDGSSYFKPKGFLISHCCDFVAWLVMFCVAVVLNDFFLFVLASPCSTASERRLPFRSAHSVVFVGVTRLHIFFSIDTKNFVQNHMHRRNEQISNDNNLFSPLFLRSFFSCIRGRYIRWACPFPPPF